MERYPNDADGIEAAEIRWVGTGFAAHTWQRLGRGKHALVRFQTRDTWAQAYEDLIRMVSEMDNPREDEHGHAA